MSLSPVLVTLRSQLPCLYICLGVVDILLSWVIEFDRSLPLLKKAYHSEKT
jgi:hypothetical protein